MRLLAIDAGNSRVKWAFAEDGEWRERGAVATAAAIELADALAQLPSPQRIVVTNVAGEAVARTIEDAMRRFGVVPEIVTGREEQCGVRSSYADPQQLGPDRWAALIGARAMYDGPCVVVNAGTTMTVDALSSEGVFIGGFIVAGYSVMRGALAANTDRLAVQEGRFSFFPDNTGDAIVSGALNALAGAIDRMARYMSEVGEGDAVVILSGGDAELVAPLVSQRVQLVDNLVLEGLLRIGEVDV